MAQTEIHKVLDRVEKVGGTDPQLDAAVRHALEALAQAERQCPVHVPAGSTMSVDAALGLADRIVPGWSISMDDGRRIDGQWTCTLRQTPYINDDQNVAVGRAATLPLAIIAALIRALAAVQEGYG